MNWAALALAAIQLAASFLEWMKKREALLSAQEQETVKQAMRLLELTEQGKTFRSRLAELDDTQALALWEDMIK